MLIDNPRRWMATHTSFTFVRWCHTVQGQPRFFPEFASELPLSSGLLVFFAEPAGMPPTRSQDIIVVEENLRVAFRGALGAASPSASALATAALRPGHNYPDQLQPESAAYSHPLRLAAVFLRKSCSRKEKRFLLEVRKMPSAMRPP